MKPLLIFLFCLFTSFACKKDAPCTTCPPPNGADTTSHNFTFALDTLGEGNSSVLNDVAIVSENNVWAVGELYLRDSTGQFDLVRYNLVRWDGQRWHYERIQFPVCNSSGQEVGTSPFAAQCIFAFGANDVWIASLATVVHWNGQGFQRMCMPPGSLQGSFKKMWGNNGTLYLVGTNGNVTHFNGSTWQKLSSGTTVDIQDIWGATDPRSGSRMILAAASYVFQLGPMQILRINAGGSVDTIPWSTGRRVHSIWFQDEQLVFAAGGGLFMRKEDLRWREVIDLPLIFTEHVRGSAKNDVFAVGDFGYVAHYNGASWKYYTGNELPTLTDGIWSSVAPRGNLAVGVGSLTAKAIVFRATRH